MSTELPIIQGLLNQVDTLMLTGGDDLKVTQQLDKKKEELEASNSFALPCPSLQSVCGPIQTN